MCAYFFFFLLPFSGQVTRADSGIESKPVVLAPPPKSQRAQDQRCYCGLEISQTIPYEVLDIDDLVDVNFVKQGMPGYLNREVMVGDRLLSIDGRSVEHISLDELHGMLRGTLHSTVEISLVSGNDSRHSFTINVLRHRFHEFDDRRAKYAKDSYEIIEEDLGPGQVASPAKAQVLAKFTMDSPHICTKLQSFSPCILSVLSLVLSCVFACTSPECTFTVHENPFPLRHRLQGENGGWECLLKSSQRT